MAVSFDVFHNDMPCGTVWARWAEDAAEDEVGIECTIHFREVRAIGLRRMKARVRYDFTKSGAPLRGRIEGEGGEPFHIAFQDGAVKYGDHVVALDQPVDIVGQNNLFPLFALWWRRFRGGEPGTFRTWLVDVGSAIDYRLEAIDGGMRSSLGETIRIHADGEIAEVTIEGSEFGLRRSRRAFPPWRPLAGAHGPKTYHPPSDIRVDDVRIGPEERHIEATLARPGTQAPVAVAIFIGGTGVYDRHGMTASLDVGYHQLLDGLARERVASVRYEKFDSAVRTLDEAMGAMDVGTLCRDAERWLDWLNDQDWARTLPRILIGHSFGGVVALALAAKRTDIGACVLLSAPGRPLADVIADQMAWRAAQEGTSDDLRTYRETFQHAFIEALALDEEWTEQNVDPRFLLLKHQRRFLKSAMGLDPCGLLRKGSCPLIAVRGTRDVQVFDADFARLEETAHAVGRPFATLPAMGLDHHLKRTAKKGIDALIAYRDGRRRIPVSLIRALGDAVRNALKQPKA